jgi:hypothetical protein
MGKVDADMARTLRAAGWRSHNDVLAFAEKNKEKLAPFIPAPVPATPAIPVKQTGTDDLREYLYDIGQGYLGYGDAVAGVVHGGWFVVRHPFKTVYGVGTAILHPIQTGKAVWADVKEKSGTPRGKGELIGDVILSVITGGAVKAAKESKRFAKIAKLLGEKTPDALKQMRIIQGRRQYKALVSGLADQVPGMRKAGLSPEQIARKLHAQRRSLGEQFKNATDPHLLEQIHQRNIKKYSDKLGPSIQWLRKHGKSWEEIIESTTRTGGKDLGL